MLLKRIDPRVLTERSFQGALHVAIGLLDWLVPDSDSVVKATSMEDDDQDLELPAQLRDPFAVLDRDRPRSAPATESFHDDSVGSLSR